MIEPDPNFSPFAIGGSKFKTEVRTWYTNDGTRVDFEQAFSGKTILDLGYKRMHHWHRHVLQPLIIPPDEYKGFAYSQGKWNILYAPIVPVFAGRRFHGYYYFWNCRIERYDSFKQHQLLDEDYRKQHEDKPRKWWSYDPESITYQNIYGKGA